MEEKRSAATIAENVTAKVVKIFGSGFNCLAKVDDKEIKTFSTFSMLGKNGENILLQTDIVVGKEVLITKLLENLTPGKDPVATGVVGIPTVKEVKVEVPTYYEDEEDEDYFGSSSKSTNHGKYGKENRRFDKKNNGDGCRRRSQKIRGGSNNRRFDSYLEDMEDW